MAWVDESTDAVNELFDKENFEEFFATVVGIASITLSDEQWKVVAEDIRKSIEDAVDNTATNISLDIQDQTYFESESS